VDLASARFDYAGLNHLGWLRGVYVDGHDQLPRLMDDENALTSFEEGLPNEYLHYYYFARRTLAAERAAAHTRGAFLREQQHGFYARVRAGVYGEVGRPRRQRRRFGRIAALALRAPATHPLVDPVPVARRLLDGYQRRIPALAYLR
jgi:alpha-galactosidase/6-phospho-beta-glucosidase family protein